MTLLRDDARDALIRWREVIAGGLILTFGLWCAAQGGLLLVPVGLAIAALGTAWGWTALRRLRFHRPADAPGMVDVDEGRISYFGPVTGGSVGLSDLAELRLLRMRGRPVWRLKQADGQALLIPADAAGADALFDAFASLPGMDLNAVLAARDTPLAPQGGMVAAVAENRVIWRRSGAGVVRH